MNNVLDYSIGNFTQGIINSSTVYDLFELENYKYTRYSYLYSCFGRDSRIWRRESPVCALKRLLEMPRDKKNLPPLLNIDASKDILLIPQCKRFCEVARDGVSSRTVAGVTHLGIIFNFNPNCQFLRYVLEFIELLERDNENNNLDFKENFRIQGDM